jgi:hypothetical protein
MGSHSGSDIDLAQTVRRFPWPLTLIGIAVAALAKTILVQVRSGQDALNALTFEPCRKISHRPVRLCSKRSPAS